MAIRRLQSKWRKTSVLVKNAQLRTFIPKTSKMTKTRLLSMLKQYRMVYIKPDKGSLGVGVMRLDKARDSGRGAYRWRYGTTTRMFSSYDALYRAVKNRTGSKNYLVQKGIHMLRHRGRPFDIRVMVQRNPTGRWEVTGKVGRVAQPGKVVTNHHNGGKAYTLESLFSKQSVKKRKRFLQRLNKLGLGIAKQLQKPFPGFRELGIDVAVDQKYKPWILEVNTHPGMSVFRKLKNKRMYYKMFRYAKAYGRV